MPESIVDKSILLGVAKLYNTKLVECDESYNIDIDSSFRWFTIFKEIKDGKNGTKWVQSIFNGFGGSHWVWIQDKHFQSPESLKSKLDEIYNELLNKRNQQCRNL